MDSYHVNMYDYTTFSWCFIQSRCIMMQMGTSEPTPLLRRGQLTSSLARRISFSKAWMQQHSYTLLEVDGKANTMQGIHILDIMVICTCEDALYTQPPKLLELHAILQTNRTDTSRTHHSRQPQQMPLAARRHKSSTLTTYNKILRKSLRAQRA